LKPLNNIVYYKMVVRLPVGAFSAGDMVIAVRSRKKARADPKFYGQKVADIQIENKEKENKRPISETISDKGEQSKDSNEYFNIKHF